MISAVAKEYIPEGQLCRLKPGTLHLVRVAEPSLAVFTAARDLNEGEEVWVVPMDGSLTPYALGVSVPGTARVGPGFSASSPTQG